jgi:hypothetical protein
MKNDHSELRSRIQRLEHNTKRKLARNNAKGVAVRSSEFNPLQASDSMTTKRQLQTYANRLSRFTSRKTQFVPDANSNPLPSRAWREYKRQERRYAEKVNGVFNKVSPLTMPNGQTIGDRMKIMTPDHPSMANQPLNMLYRPTVRDSRSVNGLHGLEKLEQSIERKMSPEYFDYRRDSAKVSVTKFLEEIGDDKLLKRMQGLTDWQFDVLWNYTDFREDLILRYESAQQMMRSPNKRKEAWLEAIDNGAMTSAYKLMDWAEGVSE